MAVSWSQARALAREAEAASAPLDLERTAIAGATIESTKSYPGYYFGNRLILDRAPTAENVETWIAAHRERFAWRDGAYPVVLSWFEPVVHTGAIGGYEVEVQTLMLADRRAANGIKPTLGQIVPFSGADHWEQLIALEMESYAYGEAFTRWRASTFAALAAGGYGNYYGIVDSDDRLVSAAGIYFRGEVARFAGVITDPEYRRRGLASALINAILTHAQQRASACIIAAEYGSRPTALYASLGFAPFCTMHSLQNADGKGGDIVVKATASESLGLSE